MQGQDRLQRPSQHGLVAAASNRASTLLVSRNLDVVQLFCLLGVTISLAVIPQLDIDGLSWVLAHVE